LACVCVVRLWGRGKGGWGYVQAVTSYPKPKNAYSGSVVHHPSKLLGTLEGIWNPSSGNFNVLLVAFDAPPPPPASAPAGGLPPAFTTAGEEDPSEEVLLVRVVLRSWRAARPSGTGAGEREWTVRLWEGGAGVRLWEWADVNVDGWWERKPRRVRRVRENKDFMAGWTRCKD
jgi:hypothetical protein